MTLDQVLVQAISGNIIQSAHIQTIVNSLSGLSAFPKFQGTITSSNINITNSIYLNGIKIADNSGNFTNIGNISSTGSLTSYGLCENIKTLTSNYTLTTTDYTVLFDATAGSITALLPSASVNNKRIYFIKKIDSSSNAVIIDANGSELIDGSTYKSITIQNVSYSIHCNGIGWYIL